jgi:hypothetical protein
VAGPASDFAFDDDEPRSRRSRRDDEDEDNDRPRSRRNRGDDEDDDERPRYHGRQRNKGKSKVLLLILLLGGAGLVMAVGAVLVLVLDPFELFGGGPSSDMLAWAPADSQSITFINMDEARETENFRDALAGPANMNQLGIRSEDVSSIMIASRNSPGLTFLGPGNADVMVVKLNVTADQNRIINSSGGKEATIDGKKYYKTNGGGAIYFASSNLIVSTRTDATMATLLQKSDSTVVISDELRSAVKRADWTVSMASTGQAAEGADLLGLMAAFPAE